MCWTHYPNVTTGITDLAEQTNRIYCKCQHEALMNMVLSLMNPNGQKEFPQFSDLVHHKNHYQSGGIKFEKYESTCSHFL